MTRQLTGRHVLTIALGAFGIVVAANLVLLFAATGSFPGLVVENSYVASQTWNTRTGRQQALGWTAAITYAGGAVDIVLTDRDGAPVEGAALALAIGRPADDAEDTVLEPAATPDGYRFAADLAPGLWRLELRTVAGPGFRTTARLLVPEAR